MLEWFDIVMIMVVVFYVYSLIRRAHKFIDHNGLIHGTIELIFNSARKW